MVWRKRTYSGNFFDDIESIIRPLIIDVAYSIGDVLYGR